MSIVVQLDEENDFVHSESKMYPMSALLADIGGAAGLFLGLSVIGKRSKLNIKIVYCVGAISTYCLFLLKVYKKPQTKYTVLMFNFEHCPITLSPRNRPAAPPISANSADIGYILDSE